MPPLPPLEALWHWVGGEPSALRRLQLTGVAPVLPSSFAVDLAAQLSIGGCALAAAELGAARGGPVQQVVVDRLDAAVEFRSERYLRIEGQAPADPWDRVAGLYRCGAGGWVRLHTNFPVHRDAVLQVLGCRHDREAVQAALLEWEGVALEDAVHAAGGVAAALRPFAVWERHPQALAMAERPVLQFDLVADAPPRPLPPLPPGARPLHGLRVLDLSRVIAGPVAARTLAAYGAQVLMVTGPHLPTIEALLPDTGRGKRCTELDLRVPEQSQALWRLIEQADVVLQAYRPGSLAARGFSALAMAARCPGLVCAELSAWGDAGPWAGRRGFDSLVQTAAGFNADEAEAAGVDEPRALPAQALDHASGFLLALGTVQALRRRAERGGSWRVRGSLLQTAQWLRSLGRVPGGWGTREPTPDQVVARLEGMPSDWGSLQAVRHAAQFSVTPVAWDHPPARLGSHPPHWV